MIRQPSTPGARGEKWTLINSRDLSNCLIGATERVMNELMNDRVGPAHYNLLFAISVLLPATISILISLQTSESSRVKVTVLISKACFKVFFFFFFHCNGK